MLGRRAALAAVVASAAAFGGGVALAAGHGSSHPSKPAGHVQNIAREQKAAPKQHVHHCPNMGGAGSMDSPAI